MKKIVLVLSLFAAGCVAMGTQIQEKQLSKLEKGKTTMQEVVANLGQPSTNTYNSDGTRTIAYMYMEAQTRPETFIPFIGGLIGGADSRSNVVTLRFDKNGTLLDYSSSTSSVGTGMGISSGTTFDRVEDQPKQAK